MNLRIKENLCTHVIYFVVFYVVTTYFSRRDLVWPRALYHATHPSNFLTYLYVLAVHGYTITRNCEWGQLNVAALEGAFRLLEI